jgi:hypothetical protein
LTKEIKYIAHPRNRNTPKIKWEREVLTISKGEAERKSSSLDSVRGEYWNVTLCLFAVQRHT